MRKVCTIPVGIAGLWAADSWQTKPMANGATRRSKDSEQFALGQDDERFGGWTEGLGSDAGGSGGLGGDDSQSRSGADECLERARACLAATCHRGSIDGGLDSQAGHLFQLTVVCWQSAMPVKQALARPQVWNRSRHLARSAKVPGRQLQLCDRGGWRPGRAWSRLTPRAKARLLERDQPLRERQAIAPRHGHRGRTARPVVEIIFAFAKTTAFTRRRQRRRIFHAAGRRR